MQKRTRKRKMTDLVGQLQGKMLVCLKMVDGKLSAGSVYLASVKGGAD